MTYSDYFLEQLSKKVLVADYVHISGERDSKLIRTYFVDSVHDLDTSNYYKVEYNSDGSVSTYTSRVAS